MIMDKKIFENKVVPYEMVLNSISSTRELVERILPEGEIESLKIGAKAIEEVIKGAVEKANDGLPVIGHHFAFQREYLYCFDCVPICVEGTSYLLSALLPDGVEKFYDVMLSWGHPFHTCTSQKGVMGMTLEDLFKFDAIITPTAPCDNTFASYPFFEYKDIPLVIPDIPYLHEKKSYEYYGQQLRLSLNKLGQIIGQEPDFERMKKHIEIENKIHAIQLELFELRKAKPCPVENMFNAISAGVSVFASGTSEKLEFYEKYLEIAKQKYKNKSEYGKEEKIRSIWPYMLIFFDLSLCEYLDREIGMSVLFDIFNYNFSNPINTKEDLDTLFYDMARRGMNFPMMKESTEFYYPFIENCVQLAKDFSADCFVFTSHLGCKQFGSVPQVLREALREEVGIPMLIIDLDVGDKRFTSTKIIKDKINMFSKTIL
jgi:benzoyl-CoA reductase/2-hydroxyglutaryl-CoA dehydratase subunit BcrC/BadD/HgdB